MLTATPTLGTDSDDSANNVNYQWQRSIDGTNWTNISGATANTYTAAESDENGFLRVVASFTDDTAQTVTAVSSATAKVIDVTPSLTVSLSGVPQDGEVLTAIPAVITDADNSASDVTYQWQRSTDDSTWSNISGATGGSYTLTAADVGDFVRTVASFSDDTGQSAMANSPGTYKSQGHSSPYSIQRLVSPCRRLGNRTAGPVSGIQYDYINITSDSLNISASTPNWFIHSGSGNDAIAASSGINVLDGGTGSNFLTGGSGTDTFFVDDRATHCRHLEHGQWFPCRGRCDDLGRYATRLQSNMGRWTRSNRLHRSDPTRDLCWQTNSVIDIGRLQSARTWQAGVCQSPLAPWVAAPTCTSMEIAEETPTVVTVLTTIGQVGQDGHPHKSHPRKNVFENPDWSPKTLDGHDDILSRPLVRISVYAGSHEVSFRARVLLANLTDQPAADTRLGLIRGRAATLPTMTNGAMVKPPPEP